jgi:hypothetical protein
MHGTPRAIFPRCSLAMGKKASFLRRGLRKIGNSEPNKRTFYYWIAGQYNATGQPVRFSQTILTMLAKATAVLALAGSAAAFAPTVSRDDHAPTSRVIKWRKSHVRGRSACENALLWNIS